MRVDLETNPTDPRAFCHAPYCNGVALRFCLMADEEAGEALCLMADARGRLIEDGQGNVIPVVYYGHIELRP